MRRVGGLCDPSRSNGLREWMKEQHAMCLPAILCDGMCFAREMRADVGSEDHVERVYWFKIHTSLIYGTGQTMATQNDSRDGVITTT